MHVVTEGRVSSSRHSPARWTGWLVAVTATSPLLSWRLGLLHLGFVKGPDRARMCAAAEDTGPCGVVTCFGLGKGEEAGEVVTVGSPPEKVHLRKVNCACQGQRMCPLFRNH